MKSEFFLGHKITDMLCIHPDALVDGFDSQIIHCLNIMDNFIKQKYDITLSDQDKQNLLSSMGFSLYENSNG